MSKKGSSLSREETANLLEEIAKHIIDGDRSFDLQLPITQAQEAMLEMRHMDGMKLLNRIALLLLTSDGKANVGNDFTRKRVEALNPLDPMEDSKALQILADEVRSKDGST